MNIKSIPECDKKFFLSLVDLEKMTTLELYNRAVKFGFIDDTKPQCKTRESIIKMMRA